MSGGGFLATTAAALVPMAHLLPHDPRGGEPCVAAAADETLVIRAAARTQGEELGCHRAAAVSLDEDISSEGSGGLGSSLGGSSTTGSKAGRPSLIHSFVHSFVRSFGHSFIHSFIHSFVRSFGHSVIRSFGHSFVFFALSLNQVQLWVYTVGRVM